MRTDGAGHISILGAMSESRVIGRSGSLPWHLPEDLKRVKTLTSGHVIIMGRLTYESIGRPLPDRTTVVISRKRGTDLFLRGQDKSVPLFVRTLDEALDAAWADARGQAHDEVFIMGGAEIYGLALPRADRLYLTIVHAEIEGDTVFPPFDLEEWELRDRARHEADERHAYPFSFEYYERKSPTPQPAPQSADEDRSPGARSSRR